MNVEIQLLLALAAGVFLGFVVFSLLLERTMFRHWYLDGYSAGWLDGHRDAAEWVERECARLREQAEASQESPHLLTKSQSCRS